MRFSSTAQTQHKSTAQTDPNSYAARGRRAAHDSGAGIPGKPGAPSQTQNSMNFGGNAGDLPALSEPARFTSRVRVEATLPAIGGGAYRAAHSVPSS